MGGGLDDDEDASSAASGSSSSGDEDDDGDYMVFGRATIKAQSLALSDVGALVAALFSNLLCTLVLMIVVDREHKILTIIVLVFAMLQPLYVGWRLVDIIVQRLVLDSELYANVWLSVMLPTLILAVVVPRLGSAPSKHGLASPKVSGRRTTTVFFDIRIVQNKFHDFSG